jgi:hypothetical protein
MVLVAEIGEVPGGGGGGGFGPPVKIKLFGEPVRRVDLVLSLPSIP